MPEIIENGLYRLPGTEGHCRHGLVRIVRGRTGNLLAVDTYWGYGDAIEVDAVKDRLEFIIDLSKTKVVDSRTWAQYEEKDRAYIPIGGGSERYLVLEDPKPSLEKRLNQLFEEVRVARDEIEYAIRTIANKHEEIAMLRAQQERELKATEGH